jgi:hypothetical protein
MTKRRAKEVLPAAWAARLYQRWPLWLRLLIGGRPS